MSTANRDDVVEQLKLKTASGKRKTENRKWKTEAEVSKKFSTQSHLVYFDRFHSRVSVCVAYAGNVKSEP